MFGKRIRRGGISASLLSGQIMIGALPTDEMKVKDVNSEALIDSGCRKCIVYVSLCSRWKENISVMTVSGESYKCMVTEMVQLQLAS